MTRFDRFSGSLVGLIAVVCPALAWADNARLTLDVDYSQGLGSAGSWSVYGRIDDTGEGANGEHGLSAVRFFLSGIDFGDAGESISLSPDIGALDPINEGGPNERPPAVLRPDGLIDLIYGQDLAESGGNTIVFGVGASGNTLLASGTFSAGMSPGFGRDNNSPNAATTQALFLPAGSTPIVSGALPADRTLTRVIDDVSILGDYTGDGLVNAADYTVWRDQLGSSSNLAADGDGDQIVDDDDYLVWTESYGNGSGAEAIPEPIPCSLVGLATTIVSMRQRRWVS